MSHDLRHGLGYRALPTSDPKEAELRAKWYETRTKANLSESPEDVAAHRAAHEELSSYLWKRTEAAVEADRRKHPKAKRNAPVGSAIGAGGTKAQPGGRSLP